MSTLPEAEQTVSVAGDPAQPSLGAELTEENRLALEDVFTAPSEIQAAIQRLSDNYTAPEPTEADAAVSEFSQQQSKFFSILKERFAETPSHYKRPEGISPDEVKESLIASPDLMLSLLRSEESGGKPDVIAIEGNAFVFADCCKETPESRRNLDFNQATKAANTLGLKLIGPSYYVIMHTTGTFDLKAQCWIETTPDILSGRNALYGTRSGNGGRVTYKGLLDTNPSTGWRGILKVPKV